VLIAGLAAIVGKSAESDAVGTTIGALTFAVVAGRDPSTGFAAGPSSLADRTTLVGLGEVGVGHCATDAEAAELRLELDPAGIDSFAGSSSATAGSTVRLSFFLRFSLGLGTGGVDEIVGAFEVGFTGAVGVASSCDALPDFARPLCTLAAAVSAACGGGGGAGRPGTSRIGDGGSASGESTGEREREREREREMASCQQAKSSVVSTLVNCLMRGRCVCVCVCVCVHAM
jgi:hypothetical protein